MMAEILVRNFLTQTEDRREKLSNFGKRSK